MYGVPKILGHRYSTSQGTSYRISRDVPRQLGPRVSHQLGSKKICGISWTFDGSPGQLCQNSVYGTTANLSRDTSWDAPHLVGGTLGLGTSQDSKNIPGCPSPGGGTLGPRHLLSYLSQDVPGHPSPCGGTLGPRLLLSHMSWDIPGYSVHPLTGGAPLVPDFCCPICLGTSQDILGCPPPVADLVWL
jgi:hypothetical protein